MKKKIGKQFNPHLQSLSYFLLMRDRVLLLDTIDSASESGTRSLLLLEKKQTVKVKFQLKITKERQA